MATEGRRQFVQRKKPRGNYRMEQQGAEGGSEHDADFIVSKHTEHFASVTKIVITQEPLYIILPQRSMHLFTSAEHHGTPARPTNA